MQLGNIKAFTVLCNHHQCLHSHHLILSPHFPENPCQALPISSSSTWKHLVFLFLHFFPFFGCPQSMPMTEMIEKIDSFFLTEKEFYRRLVVLDSLQFHGFYSPWSYLGQKTGMGNFSILQGIFLTLHILQIQVENYLFYFIWSILSVKEGTV